VIPSGRFAYLANYGDDTVCAYAINGSTGALRAVTGLPFAAAGQPYSVTVEPSGQLADVTNKNAAIVSAYLVNSSTGALSKVAGSAGDIVRDTISGDSMKSREPDSRQTAWLTRVQ